MADMPANQPVWAICGRFDLLMENHAHWLEFEMTFNPERMRIK
ncbi:hypothetical protein ACFO5X_02010 [Seohaeicola nanhaiensis]|uniref:Uncharacterized protein n=1 Tax=Seohaeicola nanhaiensis TaxID=1387282 RepID=A0ABV9KBG9_9RHOB